MAFIPFAAAVPFETWLMPKRHQSDFGWISDMEKSELILALYDLLMRLHQKLNDPDFNYIINSTARKTNTPELHWFVHIRPRLITRAGFEIGSGMRINPSLPENDADFLNEDWVEKNA